MANLKKVAVVTGANRGLGLETCRQLAAQGYQVVLTARDETKGKAAVENLRKKGHEVLFHRLDVTDSESISTLTQWLEKELKRVDVLVNNAGIYVREPTIEGIRKAMETNVYGPF
ncbi:SDR family NAD(P)-dependent oxidoreductase, partial [Bdellovibrionota bacterium FG-1]